MTQMECLLGIDEAAKILGIPRTSLRGKVQRRQVPFVRLHRRILFSPSALRDFIEANTVQPRLRREGE